MIKKILVTASALAFVSSALVAPALAENGSSTASSTPAKHQPVVNLACVQAAVAKREAAVSASYDAWYQGVKATLAARQSALNAAWGMTDAKTRRTAIKAAWNAYSSALKTANKTARSARKAAWEQFKKDAKACGGSNEEESGQGLDVSQ